MFIHAAYEKKWNRTILSILWLVTFIAFICHALITELLSDPFSHPFQNHMLKDGTPAYFMAIAMLLLLELVIRKFTSWAHLALIAASHILSCMLVLYLYRDIHVAPVTFVFPLLVTCIFFRPLYLAVSVPVSIAELMWVFWETPPFDIPAVIAIIIVSSIIAGSYLAGFGVIARGKMLVQSLQRSIESEQELLIQNIIMDRMSKMDPLTGLYNHKSFQEYFDKLTSPEQSKAFPFQLAVIDIDNFKRVNDTYGHAVGDIALKQVASSIQEHMEPNDFAARYGGEEFVVLLHEPSVEAAYSKLERIRKQIARTPIDEMNRLPVTVSIGLHAYTGQESKVDCFAKADGALYASKNEGKNRITVL